MTELSSSCSGLVLHPPGTEVLVHTNAREALGLVGEREEEGDNLRGGGGVEEGRVISSMKWGPHFTFLMGAWPFSLNHYMLY